MYPGYRFESVEDHPLKPNLCAKFIKDESNTDESQDATLELEGALLVAADGVNSGVRDFLGLPPAEAVGSVVWRGSVEIPEDHPTLGALLNKGVHPLGYVSLSGLTSVSVLNFHSKYPRVMTWSVSSKDSSLTHPRQAVEPYLTQDVAKEVDLSSVLESIFVLADPDDLTWKIPFKTTRLPEKDEQGWGGRGRVALVGDAARAIRSAGGQAGGMAFEDVCVLTRLLKDARLNNGDGHFGDYQSTRELLRRFENIRLPRARTIAKDAYDRVERVYKSIKLSEEEEKADRELLEWIYKGV